MSTFLNPNAVSLCALVLAAACGAHAATPAPGASTSTAQTAPRSAAPHDGTIGSALALPAGPGMTLQIGCEANVFVGPFVLTQRPETLTLVGTNRSVDGAQVCAPTAEWVDSAGAFVGTAGFGCPEGTAVTDSEISYEYSPDNGGNSATPVYLHIHREDPAGCPGAEITLARR